MYQAGRPVKHRPATGPVRRNRASALDTPERDHQRNWAPCSALITLESYNVPVAERLLCTMALEATGNIVDAAQLLGITRHALKRRKVKHNIAWPKRGGTPA